MPKSIVLPATASALLVFRVSVMVGPGGRVGDVTSSLHPAASMSHVAFCIVTPAPSVPSRALKVKVDFETAEEDIIRGQGLRFSP